VYPGLDDNFFNLRHERITSARYSAMQFVSPVVLYSRNVLYSIVHACRHSLPVQILSDSRFPTFWYTKLSAVRAAVTIPTKGSNFTARAGPPDIHLRRHRHASTFVTSSYSRRRHTKNISRNAYCILSTEH
jgi:hypothetical protein